MRHASRKSVLANTKGFAWVLLMFAFVSCVSQTREATRPGGGIPKPDNAIEISIIYAPEEELYIVDAIREFNRSFAGGVNPVTGARLAKDERPIYVTGRSGSSGTIHQGIINAIIAPGNVNVERPTIFSPSVSHWLALVNYQAGRQVFDLADSPPTALAPVVMAIWESRLKAIQERNGGKPVGWEELLAVLRAPDGWASYGISGRTTVYYGHTDPYISSTALSTLIAEFYASARYHASQRDFRRLTLDIVDDPNVQQGVRDIEAMIKHYSSRTTEFKEYIAQGPGYLDFVALEENDLIYINQGKTTYRPPEKLVALYPKEGTFWHEHPFAIPNADWVTEEQRQAAKAFTQYVRSEGVQKKVLEAGFRPANVNVPVGYPIVPELGVDPLQPTTVLDVPAPEVIAAVQASWQYVKKQADVLLVIDTSGSMRGQKIEQARKAAHLFLTKIPPQNRVGLIAFSDTSRVLVPINSFEAVGDELRRQIDGLQAGGDTSLYDTIVTTVQSIQQDEGDRIRAIIVLSDGQDTSSRLSLRDVTSLDLGERNPILIFPVAYGSDADINALNGIARASSTKVLSGDASGIEELFLLISSYF